MTRTELETLLNTLGCQVFYNHTTRKDVVTLPYIVYLETGSNNTKADNKVYYENMDYLVVIHSITRETQIETSLKTLLNTNRITYELNGVDWDEDNLFYQVSYNVYP